MQWIKRHKILVTVLAVILLLIGSAFTYVWSKLSLIQFDAEEISTTQMQITETTEITVETEAEGNDETTEPETQEEEYEEIILIDESATDLEYVETEPVLPQVPVKQKIEKKDDIINIV